MALNTTSGSIIGRIKFRYLFLINGLLFAAMSVLAWFSPTVNYYWLPIFPIVADGFAFSSYIIYNLVIISLFLTMYNLHPEPFERKKESEDVHDFSGCVFRNSISFE